MALLTATNLSLEFKSYGRVLDPAPLVALTAELTSAQFAAIASVQEFERLNKAIEASKFTVPIAAEYSLADAAEAHRRLEAGHLLGKIVLRVR